MTWVSRRWKYPGQASTTRAKERWTLWVAEWLFQNSRLAEGGSRPYTDEEAEDEDFIIRRSLDFIQELWNDIDNDQMWKDNKVVTEVRHPIIL